MMGDDIVIENDQQYAAVKAATTAYEENQAAQRRAERDAYLQPLRDLVNAPAYADFLTRASALAPNYASDQSINVHLGPLPGFLARLKQTAA